MSDLLPMDLLVIVRAAPVSARAPLVCSVCGDPEWMAVKPGTLSTAEMYPASNVVALRSDDGKPMIAWCAVCHLQRFGGRKS